ncbi:MAG: hypothetical protein J2P17_14590 [Mycobacterium sp.]|nr:hypothetical protein [Mycobacterium sp.]
MPNNTAEIIDKLNQLNPPATALLDSEFVPVTGFSDAAEIVTTDQGKFISSPVDGWTLHPLVGGE